MQMPGDAATRYRWRSAHAKAERIMLAVVLAVTAIGAIPTGASATAPSVPLVTNGTVYSILNSGSRIYVAGRFSRVSTTPLGEAATLDESSGAASSAAAQVVGGQVMATISDGKAGWYIGGSFTSVGGHQRSGLAHLLANGSLDTTFNPTVEEGSFSNRVDALALSGGVLYIGGQFSQVDGQTQADLAAVNATTGSLETSFAPTIAGSTATNTPLGQVNALAISGTTLYVGGDFQTVNGQAQADLAAVSTSDGSINATFAPSISAPAGCPPCGPAISTLALSGGELYLGGRFDHVDGSAQAGLAAVSPSTGALDTSFVPTLAASFAGELPTVSTLVAASGTLYVGGRFTHVGGETHSDLAAVNATDGSVVSGFTANFQGTSTITSLAIEGTTLYVGGEFSALNASARSNLAAVNAATGSVLSWNPEPGGVVDALATASGKLETGGDVRFVGGTARSGVLALSESGSLDSAFDPVVTGTGVQHLALSGGILYMAAGNFAGFSGVDGQPRAGLAAVSTTDGALDTAFAPSVNSATFAAITVAEERLYIAGGFTQVDGQSRSSLAALSATNGSLIANFDPTGINGNGVSAIATASGTVYIGGQFVTEVDGQPVPGLAALHSSDGSLVSAFSPAIAASEVYALATDGTHLYVGGNLTSSGEPAELAVLNTANGSLDGSFSGNPGFFGVINTLDLANGDLFIGGNFSSNTVPHTEAAALNASTGSLDSALTPPAIGGIAVNGAGGAISSEVYALAATGTSLYIGGNFQAVGMIPAGGLAVLPFSPVPSCQAINAAATAGVATTIELSCHDPGGGSLSYSIVTPPSHGTLGTPNASGQITYTPAAGYTGTDQFTYEATAADGTSQPATVTITVSGGEGGSGGTGGGGSEPGGNPSAGSGGSQAGGTVQTGQTGPSPGAITAALTALLNTKTPPPTITGVLRTGGFSLTFSAPGSGTLRIRWMASVGHGAHHATSVVIASGTHSFSAAERGAVKLHLTAAGRKLLKKVKGLRMIEVVSFTPSGGVVQTKQTTLTIRSRKTGKHH